MDIKVEWTGTYPTFCSGAWVILVDGIRLVGIENKPFNTYGTYDEWWFEDWAETFGSYEDGLTFLEWDKDTNGLRTSLERHHIKMTPEQWYELFKAINAQDWREGSCGGCI